MKTAVVGLGLIGGSLAKELHLGGFASPLLGVELHPEHQRAAERLGLADRVVPLEQAMAESELVVLAIPVNAIEKVLPRALDLAGPNTTVTDVGSTKQGICKVVATHPKRRQFVAAHPIAGTENSGPEAAIAGLFTGKTAVLCDREHSGAEHLLRVETLYTQLKMRLVYMSATDHDVHTAFISHLSHISSFTLANTVLDKGNDVAAIFDLAGSGFDSTVRLAKSSPDMWAPIFEQNRENVAEALDSYIRHLQLFATTLKKGDTRGLHALMEKANEIRPVLQNLGKKGAR